MQNPPDPSFSVGVVILAAGRSSRMGRPKLLLPWRATTVLGQLVSQWRTLAASQIAVVLSPNASAIQDELRRLDCPQDNCILNSDPDRGMFSSIQCAAEWKGWKAELTHWILVLGDQPHLRIETLRQLLEFGANHPDCICQPLRNRRRRHPVLLPKKALLALTTENVTDLKQFLESESGNLAGFESDDPGLDFDLDTPEQYEHLRHRFEDEIEPRKRGGAERASAD